MLANIFLAGTRCQYNVRLMLDMISDRHCILVENENRVDVSIWRQFDVDLTLDFGYTQPKNNKYQRQMMSVLGINLALT